MTAMVDLLSEYHISFGPRPLVFPLIAKNTFYPRSRENLAQNSKFRFFVFMVKLYVKIGVFEVTEQHETVSFDVPIFF